MFKINDFTLLDVQYNPDREVIDYGVRMVGAPLEWGETMGENVRVGVIDTGVDTDHVELCNRIKDGINTIGGSSIEDDNGHGTHISGIIAAEKNGVGVVGVAPKADLYIAKAFAKDGTSNFTAIEKAINWMIDRKVNVVNMSFSSTAGGRIYTELIRRLHQSGISVICAAGNEGEQGDNTIGYPARFPETVAVSAVDINKHIATFSSKGNSAEICAAGIDIYSTYLDGGYAVLSGTSMAAPIITGAVALLQGKGRLRYGRWLTPDEIRLLLNIYTENLSGNVGRDTSSGYGLFSFGRISGNDYIKVPESQPSTASINTDIIKAALAVMISQM
ncbi:MAG: S8 family peptidase [Clostridia bacterium]|nr:S8 family peptidase [Clostridia bacterium]